MAKSDNRIFVIILLSLFILGTQPAFAEKSFQGKINSDNINIRSDSTVSSEIICTIDKGQFVEVVSELYDWYKIKLPKRAPSFIKKDLLEPLDDNTAKVSKDIVNVRLKPNDASMVLGKAKENEIVNILKEQGDWLKIEPVNNSFGWIHKKFVDKATKKEVVEKNKLVEIPEEISALPEEQNITIEGIIRPKTITRVASHKLITDDNKVYLLKGNKASLSALSSNRVKVIGRVIGIEEGPTFIEIIKMEALD